MERPERYEPEDIENLLHEREFDELLAEERAYVLRHLSGRHEYEAMRSLLLTVRQGQAAPPGPSPEPAVREAVMHAFRERNRPSWRIWLNSVAVPLIPKESHPSWRPALALATVAMLIVAGILVIRQWGTGPDRLVAEVRKEQRDALGRTSPVPTTEGTVAEDSTAGHMGSTGPTTTEDNEGPPSRTSAAETLQEMDLAKSVTLHETLMDNRLEDVAEVELQQGRSELVREKEDHLEQLAAAHPSRAVAADELARNQSLSNASGQVKTEAERMSKTTTRYGRQVLSRSLAQDAELIDLVATGW